MTTPRADAARETSPVFHSASSRIDAPRYFAWAALATARCFYGASTIASRCHIVGPAVATSTLSVTVGYRRCMRHRDGVRGALAAVVLIGCARAEPRSDARPDVVEEPMHKPADASAE